MMSNQEVSLSQIQRAKESVEYLWSHGFISEYEYNTITDKIADEEEAYCEKHPTCQSCGNHWYIAGTGNFGCTVIRDATESACFDSPCRYYKRGMPTVMYPTLSQIEISKRIEFGEPKSDMTKELLERWFGNETS